MPFLDLSQRDFTRFLTCTQQAHHRPYTGKLPIIGRHHLFEEPIPDFCDSIGQCVFLSPPPPFISLGPILFFLSPLGSGEDPSSSSLFLPRLHLLTSFSPPLKMTPLSTPPSSRVVSNVSLFGFATMGACSRQELLQSLFPREFLPLDLFFRLVSPWCNLCVPFFRPFFFAAFVLLFLCGFLNPASTCFASPSLLFSITITRCPPFSPSELFFFHRPFRGHLFAILAYLSTASYSTFLPFSWVWPPQEFFFFCPGGMCLLTDVCLSRFEALDLIPPLLPLGIHSQLFSIRFHCAWVPIQTGQASSPPSLPV